jgi:hypothetical protein
MAYAFDTLGYAKRLRDAGLPAQEAEAHAEAAREFIMTELVTKYDLDVSRRETEASLANLELRVMNAIEKLRHEVTEAIASVENKLTDAISSIDNKLSASIGSCRQDLESRMQRLENRFDTLELRLTVRLGGMIAVAVAVVAAVIKF